MVSHDIILPTQEPSQFDKCFYWSISLLFVFIIHIPIIFIMSTRNFDFITIIWDVEHYNNDLIQMFKDNKHKMGLLITFLFIIPTILTLGTLILFSFLRIFNIERHRCCPRTATLFWCLFSKEYFDMIAIHRGHDKNQEKEEYYSSLWSFKKRRKKSSDSLLNGDVGGHKDGYHNNNGNEYQIISTAPKEPPAVSTNISSLRDSFLIKDEEDDIFARHNNNNNNNYNNKKKRSKRKEKKKRHQSVNSDDTQELQELNY